MKLNPPKQSSKIFYILFLQVTSALVTKQWSFPQYSKRSLETWLTCVHTFIKTLTVLKRQIINKN